MMEKLFFVALIGVVLLFMGAPVATAHRVHATWGIGEIVVEAWYGGGDPMRDAGVEVFTIQDGKEEVYENGKTDENGKFVFAPRVGVENYKVVLESVGHREEVSVNLGEAPSKKGEEEIPLYARIVAGFGYLLGLAGAGMAYMGWRLKKKYEEEGKGGKIDYEISRD